jgi:TolA-binding protein
MLIRGVTKVATVLVATSLITAHAATGDELRGESQDRTPKLAIQEGTAALARGDYVGAEAAAREVFDGHSNSPRAYDARFLFSQALYGQGKYSQAMISYDATYNQAHKGAHAEDALLGLANSLIRLRFNSLACQALSRLTAEFPALRTDLRDPVAFARQEAGCR